MSAFNILSSEIQCSICKKTSHRQIQFKFGDTWHFEYQIGDKIRWGGNDIGRPSLSKVNVYGILESSNFPVCGELNIIDEFDISIENDIIVSVNPLHNIIDYHSEDGNFITCFE